MTNREIADIMGKRHDNVKRDIKKMFSSIKIGALKFEESYLDKQNKKQIEYKLPKRFILHLISNYRADLKQKIIDRLLEMEKSPTSKIDMMIQQCFMIREQENRLSAVEQKQEVIENKLEELNPETGFCTIRGFCIRNDIKLSSSEASKLGKKASNLCKEKDIDVGLIPDERFGRVNAYPMEILNEVFA